MEFFAVVVVCCRRDQEASNVSTHSSRDSIAFDSLVQLPREEEGEHLVVLLPLPHHVLEIAAVAGDVLGHLLHPFRVPAKTCKTKKQNTKPVERRAGGLLSLVSMLIQRGVHVEPQHGSAVDDE